MPDQSDPAHLSRFKLLRSLIIASTTKQNVLFPIQHMEHRFFQIQDDLLYSCVTYGDGLENKPFHGFTWTKGIGYAFLTFFVQKALGIHRFPFFPDRVFEHHPTPENQQTIMKVVQSLSPDRIDAICRELVGLYNHTQSLLQDAGLDEVHLTRMINNIDDRPTARETYAQTIMRLKKAARATGQPTVQFEMDVLNSWGDDGGYPHFPIMLRRTIPAADVLYFSNMIANRDRAHRAHRDAVEPGEWVILNRSPTGIVDFPVNDIVFDEEIYQEAHRWNTRAYEQFLKVHTPFPFRKAARIGERYVTGSSGFRLTPKGRLHSVLRKLSLWD